MAEIVSLKAVGKPTLPVDDDLIAGLEALLEKARDGQFQGIAYVVVKTNGVGSCLGSGTGWRGHLGAIQIALGAIELLKARLYREDPDLA